MQTNLTTVTEHRRRVVAPDPDARREAGACRRRQLPGLLLGLALSAAALADSKPAEPQAELGTVTISATPLNESPTDLAQPAAVLDAEDLDRHLGQTLGETLGNQPGISASGFGLGASRPIIRGLGGPRLRVLDGGIGSGDVADLSPDHAVGAEPLFSNRIEILKGPATLLYGNGAIGGIVNVVNDRIPTRLYDTPEAELVYRYDSATQERSGGGRFAGSAGNFSLHLDGAKRGTSDYEIPGFGAVDPEPGARRGVLANSDTDTETLNGGVSYFGDFGYVGVGVGHLASDYGVPGSEEGDVRIDLAQTRFDFETVLDAPLAGLEQIKLRAGYIDYRHFEIEPGGEIGTRFRNNEFEGRVEAVHAPIAGWRGAFGVQGRTRDFEAVGEEALTPPVVQTAVGAFWLEEREWEDWHLDLGLRFDNTQYDAAPGLRDRNLDTYSAAAGLRWAFLPGYYTSLNLGRAQRAPNIDELYNDGPHAATRTFEIGSPALGTESANTVDVTLGKNQGRWTWKANGFVYLIDDFVFGENLDTNGDGQADFVDEEGTVDPAGELQLIRFSQSDATFYGAEFETGYKLLENREWGALSARLFLDFVRAELQNGNPVPRLPPLRYGGGLEYRRGNWRGNLDVVRAENRDETAPLETATGGYTLLKLSAGYTLDLKPARIGIDIYGRNLLDEEIRLSTSFLKDVAPQPGRSVGVGLRVQF